MLRWLQESMFSWLKKSVYEPLAAQAKDIWDAQEELNQLGVMPAPLPNRMDCAPSVEGILAATCDGFKKGRLGIKAAEKLTIAELLPKTRVTNFAWGSILTVSKKLAEDTAAAQRCMDEQDERYKKEMEEYIDQVKSVADEMRAEPIIHAKTLQEKQAEYQHVTTERGRKGMVGITWWEFEAMLNKGLDPINPVSLYYIPKSDLCPHGRYEAGAPIPSGSSYSPGQYDKDVDRDSHNADRTYEVTTTICAGDSTCNSADHYSDNTMSASWECDRADAEQNGGTCPRP